MIKISAKSNMKYLPMMYFLPEELNVRCPTLRKLPRKIREIMQSKQHRKTVESNQFLNEIMDATASLTFRHFGFSGWKEHYTGHYPVWKLSYFLPLWAELLEAEVGWGLQALYNIPSAEEIPFFKPEFVADTMSRVVKRGIDEQGWQPILDVIKQMPCDEDYEPWDTKTRRRFRQRWYHFRYHQRREQRIVSFEDCKADDDDSVHYIEDKSARFEKSVESDEIVESFKALLKPKDKEIITLRAHGHTLEKIAEMLGYKNHSGVLKRLRAIREIFEEFERKQALKQ